MLKHKIIGAVLITSSIFVIAISFLAIFLRSQFNFLKRIPPLVYHVLDFLVVLIVFGYIAYMGFIMIISSDDR
ncbi:hypothetical protein [Metallosphaera hakonensis]|uniref:Uncharacterized protein n=1 Tax=Metallosphaera hakonensis JCM 8857 = DSM 7519 TaxID=1293036 RepID=A0A2U9ITM0_9CREN|nr:hypothetical protein [Metallosphaera hakonensis]AWR99322.1 hypothetical protein DFR87_05935 [Metallosphaera hakonensis JCM 8857 = DSM 7519]